ncbi:MAG: NCS2 family permease [Eubacteriales bacterium]|nr:NCS2 family permease [Eubacteriales bacterium]
MFEKLFKLKANNTDVKTEVMAGITTFMTMAYILAVNPNILSASGMDRNAVMGATAIGAFIATVCMAFFANYPFVLAPGMGLNAYFAYTVCIGMGYSWQVALAAVFTEGIIFIILSLTNVREAIFNSIPLNLKTGVSIGIGLYIAFIGLQNAHVVVNNDSTLVAFYSFKSALDSGSFNTIGITVLICLIGVIITGVLVAKDVKGSILIGIIATWVLGIISEIFHIYVPNPDLGFYSTIPSQILSVDAITNLPLTFGKLDFSPIFNGKILDFVIVVFAFLFVDLFDTLGTVIGVATKADMLDANGKLPKIKGALLADAIGTTAGALLGTSTVTTFIESASGVAEGGRTGLTAMTAAILFALSVFFAPLFLTIPSFATAPALIVVGYMMFTNVGKLNLQDATEVIPAFLAAIAMPFFYSISEGIAFGIISYVLLKVLTKKANKVHPIMYICAILFCLKYILI